MSSSGNNLSRGNATMSSDIPSLMQCLPLEQIALGNQKYTRPGELRKVLGVTLGSASEDYSFGVAHSKSPPAVATEELKHVKDSVEDRCRRARARANMMHDSLVKLEKYREALDLKKRQKSELLLNERSNGANMTKAVNQIHRNTQEFMGQILEERAKNIGLNKRVRTSVADVRADGRSNNVPRQQVVMEKGGDMIRDTSGGTIRFEEKIRRLPAGGEGWDTKNKKKRSIGVVSGRVINVDQDLKRAIHSKISGDSKLRSCGAQGFRSKSSLGLGGVNKLDGSFETSGSDTSTISRNDLDSATLPRDHLAILEQKFVTKGSDKPNDNEDSLAGIPNTVIKAKASRAPRTGSIKMLDSSLKVQSPSTCLQGVEKLRSSNKVAVPGVVNNHKRQIPAGSSSMAQWVGQRPHKNSRMRRANIVAPVSNPVDVHISSQGFQASDISPKTPLGTTGTIVANSVDNTTSNIKREPESIPSPFGLSESEESGAGENKHKSKADSGEVALTATVKDRFFLLPTTKNKLPATDIGDGVRRQGRSGRGLSIARTGIHYVREKPENLPTTKPLQLVKSASDKNKSKTGRPPSKKLKDRKSLVRIGSSPSTGSLDFTGESDDDREELFVAAHSARDASDHACSGSFWKKMESIFSSVSSVDMSYLKQQLSFAEELDESLSRILGGECNILGVLIRKDRPGYSCERQGDECNQETVEKASQFGNVDMGRLEKGAPLYQRVLSALIEEDESEELYIHGEGKNILLHYASDDSHCGSCNLIDTEVKDRDRMESEVESEVNFQIQKNSFMDRISCDKSVASSTTRNPSMSSSLHSNERWPGDDEFSNPDIGHAIEICSRDLGQPQTRELYVSGFANSDSKYEVMCLDDKVLLELQSIGLFPETLPDLHEGEEMINQDILELKEELYKEIGRKRRKLGYLDKAVQKGEEVERRKMEQIAMDQLIEMAYKKRLACRGNNSSKNAIRKFSRQVALSFIQRTLARCRRFEDTGNSCFSEPALQEVIFLTTPCDNDTKSADFLGSGTASNTCNEVSNHHVAASSSIERDDSCGDYFDRVKKREVLIDDVIGSASSRATSALDSSVHGGVKGQRNNRDGDQNKDSIKGNFVSGTSLSPLDGLRSERKTKRKLKQKSTQVLTAEDEHQRGYSHSVSNPSNKIDREFRPMSQQDDCKEADEPIDFANLQLNELDSIGLEVSSDLGGPQDLGSWLNFDEDGLQDHDSVGLAIPMDDLTELSMLM